MNILQWIVNSSANPEKLSLTIKGAVVFVPSLIILLSLFGFKASPESLTELINLLATFAGAAFMLFGLGRKIYLTAKTIKKE